MEWMGYLLLGAIAGLLAGLLGVGGGTVVVPGLLMIFHLTDYFPQEQHMHVAVATSLATMIMTSMSSAFAYSRRNLLVWPVFWRILPGLLVGLCFGFMLNHELNSHLTQSLFAGFLLLVAVQLMWDKPLILPAQLHPMAWLSLLGLCVGILTLLFGVGGGMLLVPLFLALSLSMHQAAGTSSLCGIFVASIGTALLFHSVYWPAACTLAISSVLSAPLGARLGIILSPRILKRCFSMILILSAWNLLVGR
jgi:uncharacterized membrane protein YfcA